jgi:hypothetical protein
VLLDRLGAANAIDWAGRSLDSTSVPAWGRRLRPEPDGSGQVPVAATIRLALVARPCKHVAVG